MLTLIAILLALILLTLLYAVAPEVLIWAVGTLLIIAALGGIGVLLMHFLGAYERELDWFGEEVLAPMLLPAFIVFYAVLFRQSKKRKTSPERTSTRVGG